MTRHEQRMESTVEWRLANIELISWLFAQGENCPDFLRGMQEAIHKYGSLTERQQEAVEKWRRTSEFHKSEEDKISGSAPELETGKQDFTGEILSTKWHTNDYGEALKMTVRLANGNRVWGTVPANIHESSEIQMPSDLHGRTISFTATLSRISPGDKHFGFFTRPSQARLI